MIEYVDEPCVRCGVAVSVARAALRVADRSRWPLCRKCSLDSRVCPECREPYINWGAHMEACYGKPPARSGEAA